MLQQYKVWGSLKSITGKIPNDLRRLPMYAFPVKITDRIGLPNPFDECRKLFLKYNVRTVLDLGGGFNPLKTICSDYSIAHMLVDLSPRVETDLKARVFHLDMMNFESVEDGMLLSFGEKKVDCVVMIQSLEHLPKEDGKRLLKKIEEWASRLIIVETPNGFIHQEGSGENPYQAHLSGWKPKDFQIRGYKMLGLNGLKVLKKKRDKGAYFSVKGIAFFDVVLTKIFYIKRYPAACFNLFAYKVMSSPKAPETTSL